MLMTMTENNKILQDILLFFNKFNINYDYKNYTILYYYFNNLNSELSNSIKNLINESNVSNENFEKIYYKLFIGLENQKDINTKLSFIIKNIKNDIDIVLKEINNGNNKINNLKINKIKENIEEIDSIISSIKNFENKILVTRADIDNVDKELLKLKEMVLMDNMTNCFNKLWFEKFCNEEKGNFCLVFIDVDNFSQINNTFGHIIGDDILRYLSILFLKYSGENNGYVVRFGGDEFVLIFKDSGDISYSLINQILEQLNVKKFVVKRTQNYFKIKFSYGISCGVCSKKEDFDKLLEESDKKMYEMKNNNKKEIK